jgi:hypothetical protein
MKRLLIAEVEPGKQCPYSRVVRKNKISCTHGKPYGHCSDNCPLPKVNGTTKRLLMMEVNPYSARALPLYALSSSSQFSLEVGVQPS